MKIKFLLLTLAVLLNGHAFADGTTQVIPLDSCLELSPLPTADEVSISYDDSCNVDASLDYVYKKKDTSLLVTTRLDGTTSSQTQIVQQSIQTQSFSSSAATPNNCGENSQDDLDAATASATQSLIDSVAQFIKTNLPVTCAQ